MKLKEVGKKFQKETDKKLIRKLTRKNIQSATFQKKKFSQKSNIKLNYLIKDYSNHNILNFH